MNDARGYNNRIVHSIAIFVLMSFGVLGQIARALFKVLQEADHHMKLDLESSVGRTEIKQNLIKVVGRGTAWVQRYGL